MGQVLKTAGFCSSGSSGQSILSHSVEVNSVTHLLFTIPNKCSFSWVMSNINFCFPATWRSFHHKKRKCGPGWCGSVDWAPACESKGCQFDSQSGHILGLPAKSCPPTGGAWEATTHWCFSPSFSFPSLLTKNKQIKCWKGNVFFKQLAMAFRSWSMYGWGAGLHNVLDYLPTKSTWPPQVPSGQVSSYKKLGSEPTSLFRCFIMTLWFRRGVRQRVYVMGFPELLVKYRFLF